jgi:hypothetical protein
MRYESRDGSVTMTTERLPVTNDQIRSTMVFLNPIACNTVMMRRSALAERQLMFREQFGNTLDYDMWSNASDTLRVCNLPVALAAYRVHASQTSQGAALDLMNDQALQVQVDLIERALGIEMSDDERATHRSATIAPLAISEPEQLETIARWFRRLKAANDSTGSFVRREFDRALARQWTTVVLAAARSGASRTATLRQGLAGARQIGLPPTAVVASAGAGVTRRLARHS